MHASIPTGATPSQLQARPLGPDSLMWRYFGDIRALLFLGQALTIETAHPVIGQGVADHSTFKTDPYGRFQRSLDLLWPVVYNTPQGALAYGVRLRERHRAIRGTFTDGKTYHAFDPEAYLWVHMHGFDMVVRLAEGAGEPLTEVQQSRLLEEWRQMGLLLGVREEDMPDDIPTFWARFDDIIQNSLAMNDTLTYLLADSYYLNIAKPPLNWLPDRVWRRVQKPFGRLLHLVTRATLPPAFREKFAVPWNAKDARDFRRVMTIANLVWKVLPARWRYLPQAYPAIADAKRRPRDYAAQPTQPHTQAEAMIAA